MPAPLFSRTATLIMSLSPEDVLGIRLAQMLRKSGLGEDLFARASYIEGLLGERQNSLSRQPHALMKDAEGFRDKLAPYFREKDIDKMLGRRDLDFYGALVGGARKAISQRNLGDAGRVSAQEVAQSLSFGETPTGKSMMSGGNIYYQGGVAARKKGLSNLTTAGIAAFLVKSAYNRTRDALQKLEPTVHADAPAGADERSTMMDMQTQDMREGIELAEMASMLFHNPKVLRAMHRDVKSQLRGEAQEAIWDAIVADPDLILITGKKIGVDQKLLADAVKRMSGREMARQVAGRTFREKVLPAMQSSMKDSRVGDELRRMRDVRQIMQQEIRRRASRTARRNTVKVRKDGGDLWIEARGQLEGPLTAAQVLSKVDDYLDDPDVVVMGRNHSLGRNQTAIPYSNAPFVIYDKQGDVVDEGYSLQSLWNKWFDRFLGWRMASVPKVLSVKPTRPGSYIYLVKVKDYGLVQITAPPDGAITTHGRHPSAVVHAAVKALKQYQKRGRWAAQRVAERFKSSTDSE